MNMVNNKFDFLSNRLTFIEVATDDLINIELWHYLSVFENHVYGIFLQYNRIKEDLDVSNSENYRNIPVPKAGLDIYYYILTWDKLKKIFEKLKIIINRLTNDSFSFPVSFTTEYRTWKQRIDHLFKEFDKDIRNEYEHPSLESYSIGNMIMWGNILIDNYGNIEAHAGKNRFAKIKKEHCLRIKQLRTELFDLFIKHFSQKPLNNELIKLRNYIEENIDLLSNKLTNFQANEKWDEFNEMFNQLIMCSLNLSTEGMPLSDQVQNKLYSILK